MTESNGDVSAEGATQQVLALRERATRELQRIQRDMDKLEQEANKWTRFLEETNGLQPNGSGEECLRETPPEEETAP
jgi:hypothetical protein